MIDASKELNRFLDARSRAFEAAFLSLARAKMGDGDYNGALDELAEIIRRTLILSNLHGRRRVLMEADKARGGKFAALPISDIVQFEEALSDLLTREPRLERSSRELSRLYNTEHVFGMARSADTELTKRVQKAIYDIQREGKGIADAEKIIMEIGPWTRNYAAVVYRTNVAENYSAGRFEEASEEPFVAEVLPAMEFVAVLDGRTRPNHAAAHGMIAATDDEIWKTFRPPIGYQCRCSPNFISRFELEERGLIDKSGKVQRYLPPTFGSAHPDEGFKVGAVGWSM